jgi:hypothetical protein
MAGLPAPAPHIANSCPPRAVDITRYVTLPDFIRDQPRLFGLPAGPVAAVSSTGFIDFNVADQGLQVPTRPGDLNKTHPGLVAPLWIYLRNMDDIAAGVALNVSTGTGTTDRNVSYWVVSWETIAPQFVIQATPSAG